MLRISHKNPYTVRYILNILKGFKKRFLFSFLNAENIDEHAYKNKQGIAVYQNNNETGLCNNSILR